MCIRSILVLALGMLMAVQTTVAQEFSGRQVSISNNLIYDATLTPNLRLGVGLSRHWSVGVTAGYRPWPTSDNTSRKWRHLLVSPDIRYWRDSVNVGWFFGANPIYSHYNVADVKFPFGLYRGVRHERRQGDLGALGLFVGRAWGLSRHWSIEAAVGAAVGYTEFDRYACGRCGTPLGQQHQWFVMPEAALNIVYTLPGRPSRKNVVVPEVPVVVPEPQPVVEPVVPAPEPVVPVVTRRTTPLVDDPLVASMADYRPYDRSRVLRKEPSNVYVYFAFAKTEIQRDLRDNAATLDHIVSVTRRMMSDSICRVRKIQIVGLSSVEGVTAFNENIATRRAQTLQAYIQQQVDVPNELFETVGGGEAWADFRDQLNDLKSSEPQYAESLQKAIDIIDSEENLTLRERKLRRLEGGRLWRYVLQQRILGEQRNACYVRLFYDKN